MLSALLSDTSRRDGQIPAKTFSNWTKLIWVWMLFKPLRFVAIYLPTIWMIFTQWLTRSRQVSKWFVKSNNPKETRMAQMTAKWLWKTKVWLSWKISSHIFRSILKIKKMAQFRNWKASLFRKRNDHQELAIHLLLKSETIKCLETLINNWLKISSGNHLNE
jgi:hypothetical protein